MLTKRGKHQGMDIPIVRRAVERSDDYLHRLIEAGHRVAVCEQMEDPAAARARGNKSVVRRDVVRLVTPARSRRRHPARCQTTIICWRSRAPAARRAPTASGSPGIDISHRGVHRQPNARTGELAARFADQSQRAIVPLRSMAIPIWDAATRIAGGDAADPRRLRTAPPRNDGCAIICGRHQWTASSAMSRLEANRRSGLPSPISPHAVGKRPPLSPPSQRSRGPTMAIDPATPRQSRIDPDASGERPRIACWMPSTWQP